MSDVLRHGRTNLTTLYLQTGDAPTSASEPDGDVFVGHARTAEYAEVACAAVNGARGHRNPHWWSSGGLIYTGVGGSLTRDWVIAVDSPEVAARIVAAVRGEAVDAKS